MRRFWILDFRFWIEEKTKISEKGGNYMFGNGRIDSVKMGLLILVLAVTVAAITTAAFAAAGTFYATTAVSAGDVVVWDSAVNYGVKTTGVEGAQAVAGVADESVTASHDCVVRQDGGRVAVNIVGTVARGQWLITSTTTGKAKGVDSPQAGVFARAVTPAGIPAPGQCYASLELGFLAFGGGPADDHASLSSLNWSVAGHTFDSNLNVGTYNFQSTGQFTNGSAGITAAQGKTAYDHSQTTTNGHGLTYTGEGHGGGLNADQLDGEEASAFADASHTHTESEITDLDHDAQKVLGKTFDDTGLADGKIWKYDAVAGKWIIGEDAGASGSGAPTTATYITQTHDPTLTAEQALADLTTGIMKNAGGTGVVSIAESGTDYSLPIAAKNNDTTLLSGISSVNVNGSDMKFSNPSGSQVNLDFGTIYGEVSGGTRTIYVATTGSDSNLGTSGAKLLTVQKAIDVVPAVITEPIVIDIAAGTYSEVVKITGKRMGSRTASLKIQGTLTNADSGTATGTQSSTTLQDTGKAWGVNAHQYKLLRATTSGNTEYAWIVSNTSNTLTIAGQWNTTPVAGSTTYSIDTIATIVNGGAGNNSIEVTDVRGVTLQYLQGQTCSNFTYADLTSSVSITACEANGASVTGSGLTSSNMSQITNAEAFFANAIGSYGMYVAVRSAIRVNRCYSRGCGDSGMYVSTNSYGNINRSRFEGNGGYGVYANMMATLNFSTGGGASNIVNSGSQTVGIYANNMSFSGSASGQSFSGGGTSYSPTIGTDGNYNSRST
jgi:hypothetical protein